MAWARDSKSRSIDARVDDDDGDDGDDGADDDDDDDDDDDELSLALFVVLFAFASPLFVRRLLLLLLASAVYKLYHRQHTVEQHHTLSITSPRRSE